MTAILDAPATPVVTGANPRELLDPWPGLFDLLTAYIARHQEVTRRYAERVMEQFLIWLEASRITTDRRVAMTSEVDHGWHAFMLHSQEYYEICEQMFGGYLHHAPPLPDSPPMTDEEIAGTMPALRSTRFGIFVDEEFWDTSFKSCCPVDPGTRLAPPANCQSGTGAPPPAA